MSKTIGQRCARADEIMGCQLALLPVECPLAVEREAQRIAALSGFIELLAGLGINGAQRPTIIGSLIARRAAPGSELAAHRWLGQTSGLGELLDVAYETLPLMSLYRVSDVLWKRHAALEPAVCQDLRRV